MRYPARMPAQPTRGVTATGEGTATGAPDVATLALGVSALEKSVADARQSAASALDAMIAALRSHGVEERDLQTRRVTLSPEFDYDKGKQRPRGFRATNVLDVRLRDIDRAGDVMDAALAAGGDRAVLHGISFEVEKPDDLRDQALEAALTDAGAKPRRSPAPVALRSDHPSSSPRRLAAFCLRSRDPR